MKKTIIVIICLVMLFGLVACKKTKDETQVVTPETTFVTISFVVSPDLYNFSAPDPISVQTGDTPELPVPVGGIPHDAHNEFCWYLDEELTQPYDATEPVTQDLTLYLFETGKVYNITYQGIDAVTLSGELVDHYQYTDEPDSKTAPLLPTVKTDGYRSELYCLELGETLIRVPTNAGMDLTLVPKAREYGINYDSLGVDYKNIVNPNPLVYDDPNATLVLKPATCEGKEFDGWIVMVWTKEKTFVVDGEEIELIDSGTKVTKLSYEMIRWGYQNFTVYAKWK